MTHAATATDNRPGTLRQYEIAHRSRTLTDNPGLTRVEYDRAYPAGCRVNEWARAAEEFVRNGGTLTRHEADCLHRHGFPVLRMFRGTDAHGLPESYMTPDVRQFNREHETTMRAARHGTAAV